MRGFASQAPAQWLAFLFILNSPTLAAAQAQPVNTGAGAEAAAAPAAEAAPSAEAPVEAASAAAAAAEQPVAAAQPEAPPEEAAAPVQDAQALERRRGNDVRTANNLEGTVGGLRLTDAGSGPRGSFRFGLTGNFFVRSEYLVNGDKNRYTGFDLTASATPIDHFELSARVATRSNSNENDDQEQYANTPQLLQAIGDLRFGAKVFYEAVPGLTIGADVGLFFLNSQSSVGMELAATSVLPRANLSMDLRELAGGVPMLIRFNAGYFIDNSAKTVEGLEDARYADVVQQFEAEGDEAPSERNEYRHLANRVERFAFGINRVDTVKLALGGEWPLEVGQKALMSPIFEWSMDLPINRQDYDCAYVVDSTQSKLPGLDSCLDKEGVDTYPQRLTAGMRVHPGVEGLSLLGAVDVGTGGTGRFVRELAPEAPYRLYLSLGYAVDTRPKPPVIREVEKPVEVPVAPPMGRVVGTIVEQGTGVSVPDAYVSFPETGMTPLFTGDAGTFISYAFGPGEVGMEIIAEGYEPGSCTATIVDAGGDVEAQCQLVALPRLGTLSGVVLNGDGEPVIGQKVTLQGMATRVLTTDALGRFKEADLPPGEYGARVELDGHLIAVKPLKVEVRQNTEMTVQLLATPKKKQIRLRKNRIVLRGKVEFATDSSDILGRSEALLTELADTLMRNPDLMKVEIQGHTDDEGDAGRNMDLSQRRADAVREWLARAGVERERMLARGFGSEKALVPNITPGNRARNRRVEIKVLERAQRDN